MRKPYYIILILLSIYSTSYGQEINEDTIQLQTITSTSVHFDSINNFPSNSLINVEEIPTHGNLQLLSLLQSRNSSLTIFNNSGSPGASMSAILRGKKSFFNGSSPLIILDGLPIDNSEWNNTISGTDQSNRLIDINPNDIASVQIIKGSVGSVLHGIRGANGVLILTSKKGSKSKPKINIKTETTVSKVGKLPLRQSTYAQGRGSNSGPEYRGPETFNAFSWGPRISSLEFSADPSYPFDKNGRLVEIGSGNGMPANAYDPYVFFQDAISQNLNASVRGGSSFLNYYISGGRNITNGVIPKTDYTRNSIYASVSSTAINKLDITASARYISSSANRNLKGSTTKGVMSGLLRNSPTFDITNGLSPSEAVDDESAYTKIDGSQRSFRNGLYDSPYWSINNNPNINDFNRFMSNVTLNFKLNNEIVFYANGGFDSYTDTREGGEEINLGLSTGNAYLHERVYNSNNLDVGVIVSKSILSNLDSKLQLGVNYFDTKTLDNIGQGFSLRSPDFIHIINTEDATLLTSELSTKNLGVLSSLDLSYKNTLNLNLSVRQDYSSTLGENQNAFTSFGIHSSLDVLKLFDNQENKNNPPQLILFAGYGRTGNSAPPGLTFSTFIPAVISGDGFISTEELNSFLEHSEVAANPNLKAEKTDAIEFGFKTSAFSDRISLVATYYNEKTSDIILLKDISPSSGFNKIYDNVATIRNSGLEISLMVNPLKLNNFSWSISAHFNNNKNIVEELNLINKSSLFLSGFTSTSSELVEGEAYGVIKGFGFVKNENGQTIIDPSGFPYSDPAKKILANPNPEYIVGLENQFKVGKNLTVSVLFDIKQGGEIYCGTCGVMDYFGVSQLSEDERNQTVVFEGVLLDGSTNSTLVNLASLDESTSEYYRVRYGFGGITEMNIYDTSWVRLRRLNINYNLSSLVKKLSFFDNFNIGIYADNLWLSTNYPGIDPETNITGNSNGLGIEYFNNPSSRSFGVNLNLSF